MNHPLKDELTALVIFLLASAHGLYEEPASYAPFRLLDAAGRLIEVMEKHGLDVTRLEQAKKGINEQRFKSMDSESLQPFLNEILIELSKAVKK
ncbi:MAG: DUF6092 family protein [Anaerolineaceae bacterium]|jgi:hypothetical protein|nr:DUF6092 family protein [Anaerolineaceae bacterium]